MQASQKCIDTLALEEGDVLRAYRCPAGKLTIGMGLTAASGVVKPVAGMVITKKQSAELTAQALARNYEPAVAAAMPRAVQHEFDAGVLFHWNTGAIARASWVGLWRAKAGRAAIEAKFVIWNKGGGKVLPGLVKRRAREVKVLIDGVYPVSSEPKSASADLARWALKMDVVEKAKALAALHTLGYRTGTDADAIPAAEIRRFQADHGLTQDGVIGRATLSTLQRRLDAAAKAKPAALAALGSTGTTATVGADLPDWTDQIAGSAWALPLLAAGAALWCGYLAWQYRDAIAAKINARAPRAAAFLRSF